MFDVAIVGGGICGCAVLYELSRYNVRAVLLEKENDVSTGTTKANSAIIHAGYDPEPGTKMAYYNVKGNALTQQLCAALDVPYLQVGSLVLAFDGEQMQMVDTLYHRGTVNGVPGLRVLTHNEVMELEPNVNPDVKAALFAPSAGITAPWALALALAELAITNGQEVLLNAEVSGITKAGGGFVLQTGKGPVEARFIVNAAGIFADKINDMAAEHTYTTYPSKGEYYLMDKAMGAIVKHILFRCPSKAGKGVLVAPTVGGNIIVGPNSEPAESNDLANTAAGMETVREMALRSVPSLDFRQSIRNFAGLRALTEHDDFILGEAEGCPGFFNMGGIQSPGLTAAPAMAEDIVSMLGEAGLALSLRKNFCGTRRVLRFRKLDAAGKAEAVRKNPLYGRIVCRCENVTEGEIVDALHSPLPPVSLDGLKRRCHSGMGRCQGGFCGPRVQELIARELGLPLADVMLDRAGTFIITGETKGGAT